MILLDTAKASELFAKYQVPIAGYLVNRVLPAELAEQGAPAYLRNRITMQRDQLAQIDRDFGNTVLARIPELERDVTGLPMIERVAQLMYGDGKLAS
jgi:arsenite-transporting ATPase